MKPKVLLAHPGTPPHAQQAALAYEEEGLLATYCTTFAYLPERWSGRMLGGLFSMVGAGSQIGRRRVARCLQPKIVTHTRFEILRTVLAVLKSENWSDLAWELTEIDFDRSVSRREMDGIQIVHGYEHSALRTFEAARSLGKFLVLEVVAPHYSLLDETLRKELENWPSLRTRHRDRLEERASRRRRRQDLEYQLADLIICNSSITEASLLGAGVSSSKIVSIPLGMPPPTSKATGPERGFSFLFAGTISPRKGGHILLDAWRRLSPPEDCELRLIGHRGLPSSLFRDLPGRVTIRDSIPRDALWAEYRNSSVLLLPTLLDGFGMVVTEALSSGLPVITTDRAGAAGLVAPMETGLVVKAGDVDALAGAMDWCLQNRAQVRAMRKRCIDAAGKWQWTDYRGQLVQEVCTRAA